MNTEKELFTHQTNFIEKNFDSHLSLPNKIHGVWFETNSTDNFYSEFVKRLICLTNQHPKETS